MGSGAMFPFAIQITEVVVEKELKLRQAMSSMGMHDLAYWLSWHVYQSAMSLLSAFFIFCFGAIFQLQLFTKNDFGVLLCASLSSSPSVVLSPLSSPVSPIFASTFTPLSHHMLRRNGHAACSSSSAGQSTAERSS